MTTATYTHAENAQFLADLARELARAAWPLDQVQRLHQMAANEAEQDPAYIDYVNTKVQTAIANPGKLHSQAEAEAIVKSWAR